MSPITRVKHVKRRPIQARAQVTRALLVEAAVQLLGRRGYAELTTNHVAERAGVSIGTVYEYFPDKQSIVAEVLDAHLAAGEALLLQRAHELAPQATARPLSELVTGWVDAMLELHAADPRLHRVLFSEVPRDRAVQARIAVLERRVTQLVESLLSTHPEARIRSPALAAQLVVNTIEALTHRWVVDESGAPVAVATLRSELIKMIVGYLT